MEPQSLFLGSRHHAWLLPEQYVYYSLYFQGSVSGSMTDEGCIVSYRGWEIGVQPETPKLSDAIGSSDRKPN